MGKWREEEIVKAKEMFMSGFSSVDISKELNRSNSSVRNKLVRVGVIKHTQKHNKSYKYSIDEEVNGLKILNKIRMNKDNCKGYLVQSIKYPDSPPYSITEYDLKNGSGCSYSRGLKVYEGNSLYSVEWVRPYLVDIEEAKSITPKSAKKVMFKCPECGTHKEGNPGNLLSQGFYCPLCSKGVSYPELLFMGFNTYKQLGFKPQQIFNDFKEYRFDFVDYNNRIIVETHGGQHFTDNNYMNYEQTLKSDKAKRLYCKNKGWTLIELDCRVSEFKFIINNINNNPLLPSITHEEESELIKIIEKNKLYPVKEIIKLYSDDKESTLSISKKFKLSHSTVGNILKKHNVTLRSPGESQKVILDESKVINQYISKRLNSREIAEKHKTSQATILKILRNNNVKIRGRWK